MRHSVGPITLLTGLLHQEEIHLLVLKESTADVILGRPWLEQHNPVISWKTGKVLKWGDSCFQSCITGCPVPAKHTPGSLAVCTTSIESPVENQSIFNPALSAVPWLQH